MGELNCAVFMEAREVVCNVLLMYDMLMVELVPSPRAVTLFLRTLLLIH